MNLCNIASKRSNKEPVVDPEDDFILVDKPNKISEEKIVTVLTSVLAKKSTNQPDKFLLNVFFAVMAMFLLLTFYIECCNHALAKKNSDNLETISKLQEELERLKEVEHQYIIKEATRDAILESSELAAREKMKRRMLGFSDDHVPTPVEYISVVTFACGLTFVLIKLIPDYMAKAYDNPKQAKSQEKVPEETEDDEEEQDDDNEEAEEDGNEEEEEDDEEEESDGEEESDDEEQEHDESE